MLNFHNSYYANFILFMFVSFNQSILVFMTVRELISELSKLDLDRSIWVFYDNGYYVFPPTPDRLANSDDLLCSDEVSISDYIIDAS